MNEKVSFTLLGALQGARRTLPICAGDFVVGAAFGVLARHTGLSIAEATLMSALVFADAAQFIALTLWAAPLPVVALVLTTFIVNIRHVLMGATLRPWLRHLFALKAYGSVFFMVDESWALTIAELREGASDAAFLIGSGGALFLTWVSATLLGAAAGALLPAPVQVARQGRSAALAGGGERRRVHRALATGQVVHRARRTRRKPDWSAARCPVMRCLPSWGWLWRPTPPAPAASGSWGMSP